MAANITSDRFHEGSTALGEKLAKDKPEYIEREAALKIIDNYAKTVTDEGLVVVNAIKDIVSVVCPTADVVPKSKYDRAINTLRAHGIYIEEESSDA